MFEYEVQDVFGTDAKGTGAKKDKNRAKVTSSSDGVGAWVEISEVETPGNDDPLLCEQRLPRLR